MKKVLLLLTLLCLCISLFAVDYEKKTFSDLGFSMKIPSDWEQKKMDSSSFQYDYKGDISFYYSNYPFDSTGSTYKDYSMFTDDYRKSVLKNTEEYYYDYWYDLFYDIEITTSEYTTIKGRTFLYMVYNGIYYDYDDCDYEDVFESVVYIVLKDGILHNFTFDCNYDYFSGDEQAMLKEIANSIDFK
ncbi:TPA: hypothetical protein DCW38_01550 [candidate division WOR-3 bacterium]|uniref:DUF4367 domain-containing protein n=1 Tax=candidate division WOR-3 bacterium TaxID=2052148 RepID=A0A350H8I6_UNCW3|nr:hypothetical protein [candidate division WOR-3 bacterium]